MSNFCPVEIRTTYSGLGCTGSIVSQVSNRTNESCGIAGCANVPCTPSACTATTFPGQSGQTTCGTSFPSIPANLQSQYVFTRFTSTTTCSGTFDTQQTTQTGACIAIYRFSGNSQKITCNADGTTNFNQFVSTDCSGAPTTSGGLSVGVCNKVAGAGARWVSSCPVPTTTATTTTTSTTKLTTSVSQTTTTTSSTQTAAPASGNSCFHIDTTITYEGQEFRLEDYAKAGDCHIPHKVIGDGVRIEMDGGRVLRLTNDHLVFADGKGLVAASDLRVGDHLFTSLDERDILTVRAIFPEHKQQYFGLNCLDSIVLANGIKTSVFGKFHMVPSWWMATVGRIVGVENASKSGDWIATIMCKIGLL